MDAASISQEIKELTSTLDGLGLEKKSSITPLEFWNALPAEVQDLILAFCSPGNLLRFRSVNKSFRDIIYRKNFQQARLRLFPKEFHLSPLVFYVQEGRWHILALDFKARIWRKLPPFPATIPAPDIDLFKDFLVASHGGLFVVNVGKPVQSEKLFVCNLLTGATEELAPLAHSRHPVVLHLRVTLTKTEDNIISSYLVIAVGSSATGTESLSRRTEVYDSVKGKWVEAGDVPGSDFSLNDHQTGVFCERENLLLCVGFTVNGSKGILAFDVAKREWLEDFPLFLPEGTVHFAIAQLVECNGVVYLFSEQESGRNVTHCIDRLDIVSGHPGHVWTRVVTRPRQGYRSLLVYPEYTCLPVGEKKLCIFNTIERSGVVYDMSEESVDPERYEELPACTPMDDGVVFHSLNPVAYAFEPSFGVSVT